MQKYFDHEKLDVYRTAIGFVVLVDEKIPTLPCGRDYLVDQIQLIDEHSFTKGRSLLL